LDGWWAEAFDPECGWALGDRSETAGNDAREAAALYAMLEDEVVPAFYERDAEGYPRRWLARMRASMARLAPRFSSARMLQEYVEQTYVPAASSLRRRVDPASGVSRELAQWSQNLERHWPDIRFGEVTEHVGAGQLTLSVPVYLGQITHDSVRVQLYASPAGAGAPVVQAMAPVATIPGAPNAAVYRATLDTARPPGDYTPRVVPYHRDAHIPIELPLIAWQR
jgi:starch phosphorylase